MKGGSEDKLKMTTQPVSATFETIAPATRAAWRAWLAEHHADSPGVWLIIRKKDSPQPGVTYVEAVEEALCFGWIDSKTITLDATRFRQIFTPRKPRGTWAKSNKERVARLIEQGLMTPAGLAAIELAVTNGTWTASDAGDEQIEPDDFADALAAHPAAELHWRHFSASVRKGILYWIASAKRPETRARRIARTVELAEQNIRVMFDRP
jgi:uncharacterized protein YdeI (YjbR/CyaY-like superfamily)